MILTPKEERIFSIKIRTVIFGEHMFYSYDLLLEKSILYRPGAAYSANRRIMFSLVRCGRLHLGVSYKNRYRKKQTNKQQQQKNTHTSTIKQLLSLHKSCGQSGHYLDPSDIFDMKLGTNLN